MGMKSTVVKNLNPVATVSWKGGVPGTPWVDNDTVTAAHNSLIFVSVVDSEAEELTINLPAITAASAGQQIRVINMVGTKDSPGDVILVVAAGDSMEWLTDEVNEEEELNVVAFRADSGPDKWHFWLVSDGVSRWSFFFPDSGMGQLFPVNG